MNRYGSLFAWSPPLPKSLPIRLCDPVISCFSDPELKNINRLLLIPSCLARAAVNMAGDSTAKPGRSKYATSPRFSPA
jgi:hypothetical protein